MTSKDDVLRSRGGITVRSCCCWGNTVKNKISSQPGSSRRDGDREGSVSEAAAIASASQAIRLGTAKWGQVPPLTQPQTQPPPRGGAGGLPGNRRGCSAAGATGRDTHLQGLVWRAAVGGRGQSPCAFQG